MYAVISAKSLLQFRGKPFRIGLKYCQKLYMAWTGALDAWYAQNVPGDSLAVHAVKAPEYEPPVSTHGCVDQQSASLVYYIDCREWRGILHEAHYCCGSGRTKVWRS